MTEMRSSLVTLTTDVQKMVESRRRAVVIPNELEKSVLQIIRRVRKYGDEALISFTRRWDGVDISGKIRVKEEEISDAYGYVSEREIAAMELSRSRLERLYNNQLERLSFLIDSDGVYIENRITPLSRAGCYVPGGKAPYVSSVIMTVVPAAVAGVQEIAVCTPPDPNGHVNPFILVAADICGIQELYRVGGVQAIAALAYGTETVRPVNKLVGPGNKFVTAAKRLVCKDVPIDMPAGPSELVVLADKTADPQYVALDLISQAEHDEDAVAILATDCQELALRVQQCIETAVQNQPRRETIESSLRKNGTILLCGKMDDCISSVNKLAPEHVEVVTATAREHADRITEAGMVLVGGYSPVAASDYCLGVNHILPTGGFSSLYSGVSVLDFIRSYSLVECSLEGLETVAPSIGLLAEIEGLEGHALAVRRRFSS